LNGRETLFKLELRARLHSVVVLALVLLLML